MKLCSHGKLLFIVLADIYISNAPGVLGIYIIHHHHAVFFHMAGMIGIIRCLGIDSGGQTAHKGCQQLCHVLDQVHIGDRIGHLRRK